MNDHTITEYREFNRVCTKSKNNKLLTFTVFLDSLIFNQDF
jgi:hypothetical protein